MSDVNESLISLTKNERMGESLMFLSESLNRSFFYKKRAIRSEIKWVNPQPCTDKDSVYQVWRILIIFVGGDIFYLYW